MGSRKGSKELASDLRHDFFMLVGSGRAAPKWGAQRLKSGAQRRPKAQRAQRAAPRRGAGGTCPLHAKNDLPLLPKSRFCTFAGSHRWPTHSFTGALQLFATIK